MGSEASEIFVVDLTVSDDENSSRLSRSGRLTSSDGEQGSGESIEGSDSPDDGTEMFRLKSNSREGAALSDSQTEGSSDKSGGYKSSTLNQSEDVFMEFPGGARFVVLSEESTDAASDTGSVEVEEPDTDARIQLLTIIRTHLAAVDSALSNPAIGEQDEVFKKLRRRFKKLGRSVLKHAGNFDSRGKLAEFSDENVVYEAVNDPNEFQSASDFDSNDEEINSRITLASESSETITAAVGVTTVTSESTSVFVNSRKRSLAAVEGSDLNDVPDVDDASRGPPSKLIRSDWNVSGMISSLRRMFRR